MKVRPGIFLKATSLLDDTVFDKAVVCITTCDPKGATGFVVNKIFSRRLNELEEFKHITGFPIYEGGPVQPGKLYFIHRRPDLVEDGTLIAEAVYLGGNFKQAVQAIHDRQAGEHDIKILIGYCGWDAGELEEEIQEGSWEPVTAPIQTIFQQ